MFAVVVDYIKPIEEIDAVLDQHRAFLEKYIALEKIIFAGRQNPRTGGFILFRGEDMTEVQAIITEDIFSMNKLAEYKIIDITPSKYAQAFEQFIP